MLYHAMFTFRPLEERDFDLLTHWRNQPHVAAWWDGPTGLAGVRKQYAPRLLPDCPVRMFIVEQEGVGLGRIQYEPSAGPLSGFGPKVANIDFLIGEEENTGQGLGPGMIDQFVREVVFADGRFGRAISDPDAQNARSIRALEKAGFQRLEEREIDGRLFTTMVRDRVS